MRMEHLSALWTSTGPRAELPFVAGTYIRAACTGATDSTWAYDMRLMQPRNELFI